MKLVTAVAVLAVGHAAAIALFWALVNVPESNVWMLALSVAIGLTLALLTAGTYAAAVLSLQGAASPRQAARTALTAWGPALLSAVVAGLVWWAARAVDEAVVARAGEIDAWFITQFGRSETTAIHRALGWLTGFFEFVVAPALGATALSVALLEGLSSLASWSWVGRALSIRSLTQTALAVFLCLRGPWQLAYWRPQGLPPNQTEIVFAATKIGVIFLLANVGVAILLASGLRAAQSRIDERAHL